ncbi:hypothetical protein [Nocardia shimofusensis]|uniref:hypothetical protein n=1 Tax=Nocardia shimofusensis TaxID=228596 RepID=UPI000B33CB64|nr:hypothetical protein [Nocardia shimofusensis]
MIGNIVGRLVGTAAWIALVAASAACGLPFGGDRITIVDEPPAFAAAFDRLCDGSGVTQLGDVIANSGVAIGDWDRWYSFSGPFSEEKANATLGVDDATWDGYTDDEHVKTEIFVREGRVVYAFTNYMRAGHSFDPTVNYGNYATPDSIVTSQLHTGTLVGEPDICRAEVRGVE